MKLSPSEPQVEVSNLFNEVCRFDLSKPGFGVVDFGTDFGSQQLRRTMVQVKLALSELYFEATGKRLGFASMARFNQQTTTKFHRDNAPAESFLLLGYEPTTVQSRLSMGDYSRRAHEMGITPEELLEKHNPMFKGGEEILTGCISKVADFNSSHFQCVFINNSSCPLDPAGRKPQGVLHRGEIMAPDASARRIINSTMLVALRDEETETVSAETQKEFVASDTLAPDFY